MTNELKPCPMIQAELAELRQHVDENPGDRDGFGSATVARLLDTIDMLCRPSPAPTVSVEECVEAVLRETDLPRSEQLREAVVVVHSLCVSRLTGAATLTLAEIAERLRRAAFDADSSGQHADAFKLWRASSVIDGDAGGATREEAIEAARAALRKYGVHQDGCPWCDHEELCDQFTPCTCGLERTLRSLASHPASVAGEARPSFEEVKTAFFRARAKTAGSGVERNVAGLRAVMSLYERGAK